MSESNPDIELLLRANEKLRARNIELEEQLSQVQKASTKNWRLTSLFREAHKLRSLHLNLPLLGERFLRLLFDLMYCDIGAFMKFERATGAFQIEHALGLTEGAPEIFTPLILPSEFQIVKALTPPDELVNLFRTLVGVSSLLWAFNPRLGAALILARSKSPRSGAIEFEFSDQPIVTNALKVLTDIYGHYLAREALQKTRERMELVIKGADLGMWDWNIATDEVFFDKRWKEMLGYTSEEIKHHYLSWQALVNPDDLEKVLVMIKAHLEGRTEIYET
ncbi:MAG: PAS domain-containing protein, partial [Planctomycetes bacterium]|nr:PAS domain-containing protein [Planctomycetota bacterium]